MSTDRELLELAAKAADQPGSWIEHPHEGWGFWQKPHGGNWDPLTDDGDALRLAVKLRLSIILSTEGPAMVMSHDVGASITDESGDTRRAIVRAAAELGKAKP